MIKLFLTRGQTAVIDNIDCDLKDNRRWLCSRNTHSGKMYVYRRDLGKRTDPRKLRYLHRVIIERILKRPLNKNEIVDHIDGNTFNNTRCNLRVCTHSQNSANSKKINSKTGYKGVVKYGSKYSVFCGLKGGPKYVGSFKTKKEAAEAYDNAAIARAGVFAATNKDLKKWKKST